MNAPKTHNFEAARPERKPAARPAGMSGSMGNGGLLPPGLVELDGMGGDHPGVKTEKSPEEMRAKIMALEAAMMDMKEHQIEIKTTHYFAPGIYMRQMFMPKGTTLTGKIHKTEHMCVLSMGEVSVYTDQGMKQLKASSVVHSMPGMKRVLYAHEDSIWINVHHNPTNERDLDKIDSIFVADTYEEFQLSHDSKTLIGEREPWMVESTQVTKQGGK